MNKKIAVALVVGLFGCSKAESTASKPVTCAVAGDMVSKRLGEFADKAKVAGTKRVELDKAMAAVVTTRCTEDKWDDVPLGCLGAMATIKEGEIDVQTYRKGIDICTDAIGKDSKDRMETEVGAVVRSTMRPAAAARVQPAPPAPEPAQPESKPAPAKNKAAARPAAAKPTVPAEDGM